MRRVGNEWPDDHVDALREYMRDHVGSHSVIAGLMNARFCSRYSRNAIIGKCARLGIPANAGKGRSVRKPKPVARVPEYSGLNPAIPGPTSPHAAAVRCVEVSPRNLPLVDLEPGDCRWPYGDGPFSFCGHHPQFDGSSYCGPHFYLSMR